MRHDRDDGEKAKIEQSALDLVDESRTTYVPNPNTFASFTGMDEAIQELVRMLETVKKEKKFTGMILYGTSRDKVALAEAVASYLGCAYYDLVTDDSAENDDLDKTTSQEFSRKFVQFLAADIKRRERAVVCWVDQADDFYKEMDDWEKELEDLFATTILTMENVIAVNVIDAPELITTDCYQPANYDFKLRVDER
ncbi:hypothetical protein [Laceyella putida]|uniref:Uncharacterized protein n=1 Tax=Laceyella putida TaxID=110101 RepID=A0ABW2RLW3_9BACL